jgi:hypothetical protein
LEFYGCELQRGVQQQALTRAHGSCFAALHVNLDGGGSWHYVCHAHHGNVVDAGVAG